MIGMMICSMSAIVAICYLEGKAMKAGINGKTLALSMALIAGLGGYCFGNVLPL
jgi:hypothetical protein